ncbi:unnamed protein product [Adineta steineri]|uniref:Uncharacterized protein n=1 Tax=Adineta steineri TaxID=433720 RepID=A0A820E5C0_9BILA|nr:unnamed protein product [Adineta steineri]
MGWCEGKEEGEIVVGENGGGSQSNQLYGPSVSPKLQADFDTLTKPSLTKTENTTCSSCLLSTNQGSLNINLSRKLG